MEAGILKKECDGVKILSNGTLTKKLTVKANAFFRGRQGEDRSRWREGRGDLSV